MASEIEVINKGLFAIGQPPILNLDSPGKAATTCKRLWPSCRDSALVLHPWKCATQYVILAPLTAAPAFKWSHQFQKPSDCLRILFCGEDEDSPEPHDTYQDKILANTNVLYLAYIMRQTNTEIWPPALVEVAALCLAEELAIPICNDPALKASVIQDRKDKLANGRFINATEGGTTPVLDATAWIDARA